MDTSLGMRSWSWRSPDWAAAAVAGLAAGAVLMVLDLLWSSIFTPEGPWRTSHMIAPIFLGRSAVGAGYSFSITVVSIALVTHYVLGVIFGLIMAAVLAQLRLDRKPGQAACAGAIMGLVLYLVNFDLLVVFFPWLAWLRGWDTVAAHVVFGVVAAYLYWRLKRTGAEG
jgi:hypothetical protein